MRGRKTGRNLLEIDFEQGELVPALTVGEVIAWTFEPFALKLAPRTTFTPDFLVQLGPAGPWFVEKLIGRSRIVAAELDTDGLLVCVDVKGHREDDARAKIKTAAELFPMFLFAEARHVTGTGWKYEILPTKQEAAN